MTTKALIVDDDDRKAEAVSAVLLKAGFLSADLTHARTCIEARNHLTAQTFDLLVVDVRLPLRSGEKPIATGGIDLLRSIYEEDAIRRPKYIVGLTAYPDLAAVHQIDFEQMVWSLITFEHGAVEWMDKLSRLATHVLSICQSRDSSTSVYDVCVITALREPEHRAVMALPWNWARDPIPLDNKHFCHEGYVEADGARLSVVTAHAHRPGMVPTALLATKLIAQFRPKLFFLVGICAGVRDRTSIGDLIVATSSWDWQAGKLFEAGACVGKAPEPDFISAPRELISRLELIGEIEISAIVARWPAGKPANAPKIHFGPLACGSSVVAAEKAMATVIAQHRKTMGLDMESYGFYSAASMAGTHEPLYAVVKSVSDLGDSKKSDEFQDYCAYLAANLIHRIVDSHGHALCTI